MITVVYLVKRRWGTEARRARLQQKRDTMQTLARSERGRTLRGRQITRYLSIENERIVSTEA